MMNKSTANTNHDSEPQFDFIVANPPFAPKPFRFIDYEAGNKALDKFEQLMKQDEKVRPECCLFLSETNNGKSSLVRRFVNQKNWRLNKDSDESRMPAVYCQMPPTPKLGDLYASILRGTKRGIPVATKEESRLRQVIDTLNKLETKILFIDEINHLLAGKHRDIQSLFNTIKFI